MVLEELLTYGGVIVGGALAGFTLHWYQFSRQKYAEADKKIAELGKQVSELEKRLETYEGEETFVGILVDVLTEPQAIENLQNALAKKTPPASFDLKFRAFSRYAKQDPGHDTHVFERKTATCTFEGENLKLVKDLYNELKSAEKSCRIEVVGKPGLFDTFQARTYKILDDPKIETTIKKHAPDFFNLIMPKFVALKKLTDEGFFEGEKKPLTLEDLTKEQREALGEGYFNNLSDTDLHGLKTVVIDPYINDGQAANVLGVKRENVEALKHYLNIRFAKEPAKPLVAPTQPEVDLNAYVGNLLRPKDLGDMQEGKKLPKAARARIIRVIKDIGDAEKARKLLINQGMNQDEAKTLVEQAKL